jgi:cell division protein FtsB
VASAAVRGRVRAAVLLALGGGALWFAIEGGEYGTSDLIRQERQRRRFTREIDSLRRVVDSLTRYKYRVVNDPATQERIAREEFGMVRGRELLYRMVAPDSQ